MFKVVNSFACAVIVLISMLTPIVNAEEIGIIPALPALSISEFMTTGCSDFDNVANKCLAEDGKQEFVELYNSTAEILNVAGWKLQYLSSSGSTVTDIFLFNGTIEPGGYVLLGYEGYAFAGEMPDVQFAHPTSQSSGVMAKSGGHIRVIDNNNQVVDLVGWGTAAITGAWPKISAPNAGLSIKRLLPNSPLWNLYPVEKYTAPSSSIEPTGGAYIESSIEAPDEEDSEDPIEELNPTEQEETQLYCKGVIISEILPNADGSDTGKEFIELHNPNTEPIPLIGCSLQISSSTKTYQLDDIVLAPGAYLAISDQVTGLTLPNAAGGTVYLLTPQEELQAVTYPGNMEEDVSWAGFNNEWLATYIPTSGTINIIQVNKPCTDNEQRNIVTGDCEKIIKTAVANLTACKVGQERNPETNRCRNIITATALVACKAGQERNPETNRCRAVNGASTLQPCDEGEERNPETNRCRKVIAAGTTNLAKVTDVKSPGAASGSKVWLLAIAGLLVIGYAVYEWRQDIGMFIGKHVSKLRR